MRLIVIIASTGRHQTLGNTLDELRRQTRLPDEVVVSAAEPADVPAHGQLPFPVRVLFGPKGLCAQRNTALSESLGRADIVTFFDDDFLAAPSYLERVEAAFSRNREFSVVHGRVIADGIGNAGYTHEQGVVLLRAVVAAPEAVQQVREDLSAYGCNMSIRAAHVGDNRFDERLPLYGWQEDADFTARVGASGRVVWLSDVIGVHLGVKGSRVSGRRFGYSQIVNPLYLVRKGSMPLPVAARLMLKNMAANCIRSLAPEPWIDRRGRLKGNLIGISHIIKGRLEPEHVLEL